MTLPIKCVYYFGPEGVEGDASMKNTLGGKGANLAAMAKLGLPVPSGFTITTEFCDVFPKGGKIFPESLKAEVAAALAKTEQAMGMKYGDPTNALLTSCRSGARASMPGMMETVLNVGLCSKTIPGLVKKTGNERFVYDAYRRLIMMYSEVVMEKAEDIEPAEGRGVRLQLEHLMAAMKKARGVEADTALTAEDLKTLVEQFKAKIKEVLGKPFPDDPMDQLWGAIGAVFKSWFGKRAVSYRKIEGIPHEWGTACNVQSMVFGNMGDTSATGVAFSRNPATGENKFYGEWLVNAQGEDVVAGIRTPNPLNESTKNEQNKHLPSLETSMPGLYKELCEIRTKLERHYKDVQDIEFTIQEGKLYMLQCRNGKRTGTAALNMAMDMLQEGILSKREAILRVAPNCLAESLEWHVPRDIGERPIAVGLSVRGGAASGKVVLTSEDAVRLARQGDAVILIKETLCPEDIEGVRAACGVITARGGMTSPAAKVARSWGKPCIMGAPVNLSGSEKVVRIGGRSLKEGDYITIDAASGRIFSGRIPLVSPLSDPRVSVFVELVRTTDPNEYPPDAIATIGCLKDAVARYTASTGHHPVGRVVPPT